MLGFFVFMYYLYIIYSETFDRFYVGSSQAPWKRLQSHNTSKFNTYTSKYRPWVLKAVFEAGITRGDAEKIERFVKKQKSRALLLKLIDEKFVPNGKLAQLVRVPQVRH
ncbi:GIY-YIG nuclease family protein [Jejuia pallidilutea]|uniref:GIY-YIG domain-containing protein n=1 Tax=Jejuia pallidilutea TaxID=504487 RepID=A0A090VWH0_9FLAO|nr:GIY-YIG nuclease family protein [Jejuia pallidilutea]GAL68333.1 hypothetical protein JCM19301_273 [Jejuia pallidilutea]GAL88850.1 hypothetical protein JCM19538_1839 [Jejuia pallidilutea]